MSIPLWSWHSDISSAQPQCIYKSELRPEVRLTGGRSHAPASTAPLPALSQTPGRLKTDVGCGRHREMRGERQWRSHGPRLHALPSAKSHSKLTVVSYLKEGAVFFFSRNLMVTRSPEEWCKAYWYKSDGQRFKYRHLPETRRKHSY